MPVPDLNSLFNIGADVLGSSYAGNGTILLQTGSSLLEEVDSDNVELWSPSGYFARPAKATQGKPSAQTICITGREHDIAVAFRDVRANDIIEQLGFGEVQIYAAGPDNTKVCKIVLNNDGQDSQKVTITVKDTKIEVLSDGTVNIKADHVNVGNGADDSVARSTPLKTWASNQNTFNNQVIAAITAIGGLLNSPGTVSGAPGTVVPPTPISPLDSSVSSGAVKVAP